MRELLIHNFIIRISLHNDNVVQACFIQDLPIQLHLLTIILNYQHWMTLRIGMGLHYRYNTINKRYFTNDMILYHASNLSHLSCFLTETDECKSLIISLLGLTDTAGFIFTNTVLRLCFLCLRWKTSLPYS